uniref:Uncharacterized protein n=1 Tax=Rhizophora mucronata TaxID=61149 RepID=A0A2P2QAR2_RHIMU
MARVLGTMMHVIRHKIINMNVLVGATLICCNLTKSSSKLFFTS